MDYNNFIFNSDTIYEQMVESREVPLQLVGSVAAGSTRTWTSEWFRMAEAGMTVRGKAMVPGSFSNPSVTDGTFNCPVQINPPFSSFLFMNVMVQIRNFEYRAYVLINNQAGSSAYSPNRTIDFTIRVYSPPVM